jgi:GrpB-like predicted nucleotidyltransferase (UPF0157 family)
MGRELCDAGHRAGAQHAPHNGRGVHVWREGRDDQIDQLVFRDWLRAHDGDRAWYEVVKRGLAAREWDSIGDHANAKSVVVADIMRRARGG